MRKTILIIIYTVFICSIGYSADLNFTLTSDSVKCFEGSTGKITVNILSGSPGFEIKLYDKKPATKQKFLIRVYTENTTYFFSGLSAEEYYITIEDAEGNYLQKSIEIYQPEELKAGKITIEECFSNPEMNDAILKANCSGGTKPYSYLWSENTGSQTTQLAVNISRGTYRCIINDRNNCGVVTATIFFNEQVFKECFSKFE